ncbi:MAG: hypothetical protein ACXAC8_03840 [Candidatus Hodarchaeales archaeon]
MVQSDLLEYPTITFFQYRNRGQIEDFKLSKFVLSSYTNFFRKNPRNFFLLDNSFAKKELKWKKAQRRGIFYRSTDFFKSPYRPLSPILREPKYQPVHSIITHRYQHKDRNGRGHSGTAILWLHGYAENNFILQELSYFRFFHQIFKSDIITLELPHHFQRQPKDSPFSGAYYLNGNPIRMVESIRQSLQEILWLVQLLKKDYNRVIIFGVSLGGHLAALATQFVEEVDIISALSSPFLFSLNPKIVPISFKTVSQMREKGLAKYYKILYVCNLKYFAPFTTNRNTAIIGGKYDRIVPFFRTKSLASMLHKPLFAYPGGHLSLIVWLKPFLNQIDTLFKEKKL